MANRQRVAIVGKTRMKNGVCIGGLLDDTGQPVRLLPVGHTCHSESTQFEIGELWEVDLRRRVPVAPPHVEDHDEWNADFVDQIEDIEEYIRERIDPTVGAASSLFEGRVDFRATGTAYIDVNKRLPGNSVEFWELPRDLHYDPYRGKARYRMAGSSPLLVTYVGVADPVSVIEAGVLVRVSLARPWVSGFDAAERTRCSLQLSGWFVEELEEQDDDTAEDDEPIPF